MRVPFVYGDLADDDGRSAAVALFEDFEKIVARRGRRAQAWDATKLLKSQIMRWADVIRSGGIKTD
jgi:hypothetical protein